MEEVSIFMEKSIVPTEKDLMEKLGITFSLWVRIRDYVLEKYPKGLSEWNFPGKKYGWSFRIKDKKRAIIYFLPGDGYFKTAFVFGQKATDAIMESDISSTIKDDLDAAFKYAEGRGIRIDVRDAEIISDIEKLIDIKLAN